MNPSEKIRQMELLRFHLREVERVSVGTPILNPVREILAEVEDEIGELYLMEMSLRSPIIIGS